MNRLNPLERISEALDGIPSFCYESPIGWIDIIAEDDHVLRASFSEITPFSEPAAQPTIPVFAQTVELLDRYFAGERVDFSGIPVRLAHATDFQRQVWNAIQQIPYGEVRSYKWIAEQIGKPKAVRAVGSAVGANPVSILNPCHRVIRSNGALGGYGGGLERKRLLLAFEGHPIEK